MRLARTGRKRANSTSEVRVLSPTPGRCRPRFIGRCRWTGWRRCVQDDGYGKIRRDDCDDHGATPPGPSPAPTTAMKVVMIGARMCEPGTARAAVSFGTCHGPVSGFWSVVFGAAGSFGTCNGPGSGFGLWACSPSGSLRSKLQRTGLKGRSAWSGWESIPRPLVFQTVPAVSRGWAPRCRIRRKPL